LIAYTLSGGEIADLYLYPPPVSVLLSISSLPTSSTTIMSEVKDLHEMDGDSKDVVQDQVTISPTETEMAILANDAHR
jgi:hypothetical protein